LLLGYLIGRMRLWRAFKESEESPEDIVMKSIESVLKEQLMCHQRIKNIADEDHGSVKPFQNMEKI
jgi:hypothetical protein